MIYRSKETVCSITVPRDPEYLALVQDILEHPLVRSMEAYTQHGETSCLRHSINVSYLSYLYCRDHGWQARAAARAGLLHDLFLYDWHFHAKETGNYFHGLTHPRRALERPAPVQPYGQGKEYHPAAYVAADGHTAQIPRGVCDCDVRQILQPDGDVPQARDGADGIPGADG